jgi:hypothetical protein
MRIVILSFIGLALAGGIPVNPDQADDFLNYRGIFNHD